VQQLPLEVLEERLGEGIVISGPDASHAAVDAVPAADIGEGPLTFWTDQPVDTIEQLSPFSFVPQPRVAPHQPSPNERGALTAPAQEPLASALVSARGNTESLKSLLAALCQQTLQAARSEAVILDNDLPGPIRPIADAIRDGDWPFTVRVLYEPTPGLRAGRNRGICATRGQYVAITAPDITPEPGWLQVLVTAIEEEKVFAVGGRTHVIYPGGQVTALTKAARVPRRGGLARGPGIGRVAVLGHRMQPALSPPDRARRRPVPYRSKR
jgi:hypothetical protein